jgi:hypothetical protein
MLVVGLQHHLSLFYVPQTDVVTILSTPVAADSDFSTIKMLLT